MYLRTGDIKNICSKVIDCARGTNSRIYGDIFLSLGRNRCNGRFVSHCPTGDFSFLLFQKTLHYIHFVTIHTKYIHTMRNVVRTRFNSIQIETGFSQLLGLLWVLFSHPRQAGVAASPFSHF